MRLDAHLQRPGGAEPRAGRLNKGANGQKQSVICAKVVVVSTVSVSGLGSHTGVGEEWADGREFGDAGGSPGIQARLRSASDWAGTCTDLDKVWEDLDQYNRPVRSPNSAGLGASCPREAAGSSRNPVPHSPGPAQPRQDLFSRRCWLE